MNSCESGVLSCGRANSVDIVGKCLHSGVGAGPWAMEFGRSREGHRQADRRAVSLSVVGVGLIALGSAKMYGRFLGRSQ